MNSTTTHTLRLVCDEQGLDVVNLDSFVCRVPWPAEVYTANEEPDYDFLAGEMTDAVAAELNRNGYEVLPPTGLRTTNPLGALMAAVKTAVTPGPSYSESDVEFKAAHVPATDVNDLDSIQVPITRSGLTVRIDDPDTDGNRLTDVPSIMVEEYPGSWHVRLTWNEARALAKALTEITDLAEFG